MPIQENNYVKVLFRFHSNILDEETVETMWATIIDEKNGIYKLDSIPFYAPIAPDDIFCAEHDNKEQMLTYRKTIEHSGSTIVQVVLIDKSADINSIRDLFKDLGCISEKLNDSYFSMQVPSSVNYESIQRKLDFFVSKQTIDYAEPHISDKHSQEKNN